MKLRYTLLPLVAILSLTGCSTAFFNHKRVGAASAMHSKIFAVQQAVGHGGINYVYQSIKGT